LVVTSLNSAQVDQAHQQTVAIADTIEAMRSQGYRYL
jgi:hypothetical protein